MVARKTTFWLIILTLLFGCAMNTQIRNYNSDPFELLEGNIKKEGEPFVGIGYKHKKNAIPVLTYGGSTKVSTTTADDGQTENILDKINASIEKYFKTHNVITETTTKMSLLRTKEVIKKVVVLPQKVGNMVVEPVKFYTIIKYPDWNIKVEE